MNEDDDVDDDVDVSDAASSTAENQNVSSPRRALGCMTLKVVNWDWTGLP